MMSEKKNKVGKTMTQNENDLMMNRLMLAFVAAVCAVTLVMSLKNANNTIAMYETVAPIMTVCCLAVFAASLVFFIVRKMKKTDDRDRVLTRWNILGTGAVVLLCGIVYLVNPGVASVYAVALIIGACALYFIRYIYSVPFLLLSSFCLLEGFLLHAGFGLTPVRAFSRALGLLFGAGALLLPILFFVGMMMYRKKGAAVAMLHLLLCTAVPFIGSVLLWMGTFSLFFIPCSFVILALVAVYAAAAVIETVRMI